MFNHNHHLFSCLGGRSTHNLFFYSRWEAHRRFIQSQSQSHTHKNHNHKSRLEAHRRLTQSQSHKKITITILGGGAYRRRTQSKSTRTAFTLSLFKSFSSYSRWEANRRLTQSQSHTSITITKLTIPGGRPTGGLHNHDQPEQLSHFHFHIFTLSLFK